MNTPAAQQTPPQELERLTNLLDVALEAANKAGELHRYYQGKKLDINTKASANDLVTTADTESDKAIREILTRHTPDIHLITEETYKEGDAFDVQSSWIVDPLDGTNNFAHGFPHYAVSIAYVEEGIVKVAVVLDAVKNECFTAIAGDGAKLNGTPLTTSAVPSIDKALLGTGFPCDLATNPNNNLDTFAHVRKQCQGVRRAGAAALDLAYIAAGRLDGFWELRLSPWDVAGGILLIQEAGGAVSDYDLQPIVISERHISIIASNGATMQQSLQMAIKQAKSPNI